MSQHQLTTGESAFSLIQRKATALAASTVVPESYQNNVANCLLALEMSQRLGVQPLMVMQNLHVIKGKPTWSSSFLIAVLNQSKLFSPLRFRSRKDAEGNETAWRAVATDIATGEPLEGPAVTLAMARAEGWSTRQGSKWVTMPEVMGRYRAAAMFSRLYAPELLMGFLASEEVEDIGRTATSGELRNVTEALDQLTNQPEQSITEPDGDAIPGTAGDDTAPGPVPPEARRENSPVHAPTVPKAAGEAPPTQEEADFGSDPKQVPGTFADPDLAKMFGGQEAAAHAFLVFAKWLGEAEPLSALKPERVAQIKARPGPFAVKAKLTLNQGAV